VIIILNCNGTQTIETRAPVFNKITGALRNLYGPNLKKVN